MNKIILRTLFLLYCMLSAFTLSCCIALPFAWQFDDFPKWTTAVIIPLSLIIVVTKDNVFHYFDNKNF